MAQAAKQIRKSKDLAEAAAQEQREKEEEKLKRRNRSRDRRRKVGRPQAWGPAQTQLLSEGRAYTCGVTRQVCARARACGFL